MNAASVAGNGNRDSRSALPLDFPGLYSKVYVHALEKSNHFCTLLTLSINFPGFSPFDDHSLLQKEYQVP